MSADSRATSSARGAPPDELAVFRQPAMVIGFVIGTVLLLLLIALAWSQASAGNIVGTLVLAVGLWFIWATGWWTKVVVSDHGVTIDNVFIRYVIPWNTFSEFTLDGGLVATLADGTQVGIVSFGGSLAGAFTQNRGLRDTKAALEAACGRHRPGAASGVGSYRRLIRAHWIAMLAYAVPLVGIATGIDAARHVF